MKLNHKTLEHSIVRKYELDLIQQIKNNDPKITITSHYLQQAYRASETLDEQYKGHPKLIAIVFDNYKRKK